MIDKHRWSSGLGDDAKPGVDCGLEIDSKIDRAIDGDADTVRDVDATLKRFRPLVCQMALRVMAKLPASVALDDLVQVGMIALNDALSRFDVSQHVSFETFVAKRIRGAMVDELRGSDWVSRSDRRQQRSIATAVQKLSHALGRPPGERELAGELGVTLAAYQKILGKVRDANVVYFEDLGADDNGSAFMDRLPSAEAQADATHSHELQLRESLIQAMTLLPEREQRVLTMYYEQDMNMRAIGVVLGVAESRVCQLHTQSVARLRRHLMHN